MVFGFLSLATEGSGECSVPLHFVFSVQSEHMFIFLSGLYVCHGSLLCFILSWQCFILVHPPNLHPLQTTILLLPFVSHVTEQLSLDLINCTNNHFVNSKNCSIRRNGTEHGQAKSFIQTTNALLLVCLRQSQIAGTK